MIDSRHMALPCLAVALLGILPWRPALAQQEEIIELQSNLEIVSNVLEEALELNQGSGLFGLSVGGIDSTYLYGQGLVLEVSTPLANRRSRMSLASLNGAMRTLSESRNPFEAIRRRARIDRNENASVDAGQESAEGFYENMMDRIARVDYSLYIDSTVQQASESLRSLRALGDLDASDYDALQAEIESLKSELDAKLVELEALEAQIGAAQNGDDEPAERSSLSEQLGTLLAAIEPMREQVRLRADELKQQAEQAEREYAERWRQDLQTFEASIYSALCDYGASLRNLPSGDSISIVMVNLGEESAADTRRKDKIHIIERADLVQCLSGDIDAAALQGRAVVYSY